MRDNIKEVADRIVNLIMDDSEIVEASLEAAERELGWRPKDENDEDDPRYEQFWMHASVFLMKALCRAADQLIRFKQACL